MEEVEVELTEQAKEEIEVIGKNLKEIESLITEPAEDVPNVIEDDNVDCYDIIPGAEKPEAEVSDSPEPTKETFVYETEPFERIFEFDLSKEDKANLFEEFLEIENKIEAEEQRLKAYKATAKATIEELEGEKEAIANQYRKGKSTRTVKAFWRMNYPEPGTKTLFKKVCDGVDDPILSEEMDNSDRQMTFKMWQKATGQVVEIEKRNKVDEELIKIATLIRDFNHSNKSIDEVVNVILEALEKYGQNWIDIDNHLRKYGLELEPYGDELCDMTVHAKEDSNHNSKVWLSLCIHQERKQQERVEEGNVVPQSIEPEDDDEEDED